MKRAILASLIAATTLILSCKNNTPETGNTAGDSTTAIPAATENTPLSLQQVISQSNLGADKAQSLLNSKKLVVLDFYADWCGPCKALKPNLDAIGKDMKDNIEIVSINVDDNKALADALKIQGIPLLHAYKDGKKVWESTGYMDKEPLEKELKGL